MDSIVIYTDGACRGNGGENSRGSYAFSLLCPEKKIFKFVAEMMPPYSTNNQAEIKGLYAALMAIKKRDCKLDVYCDSNYVLNFCKDWRFKWKAKGWNVDKKNLGQLRMLSNLLDTFEDVKFHHVNGHVGILGNEIVDRLCNLRLDNVAPADDERIRHMINEYVEGYGLEKIFK